MRKLPFIFLLVSIVFLDTAFKHTVYLPANSPAKGLLKTGAKQTEKYLPYLNGKRIAILGNQTSVIGKKNLVDTLKALGVNIVKVFGPEHGFRGNISNGATVKEM